MTRHTWLSIEKVREQVKAIGIKTVAQYKEWVQTENPIGIPPDPHPAYFIDEEGLRNRAPDWKRPNLVRHIKKTKKTGGRRKLRGRRKLSAAQKKAKQRARQQRWLKRQAHPINPILLALIRNQNYPEYVYQLLVEKNGQDTLLERLNGSEVIQVFVWNKQKANTVNNLLSQQTRQYLDEKQTRIIPNVNRLVQQLSNILNQVELKGEQNEQ